MDGNGRWARPAANLAPRGTWRAKGTPPHGRTVHPLRRGAPHRVSASLRKTGAGPGTKSASSSACCAASSPRTSSAHPNNVQVRIIGSRRGLDASLVRPSTMSRKDPGQHGPQLLVAFNYGGKRRSPTPCRRSPGAWRAVTAARGDHRANDRRRALHSGHPRSRPDHPYQRRTTFLEFPALAERLRRTRLRRLQLAGFRRGSLPGRARRLFRARTKVRCVEARAS